MAVGGNVNGGIHLHSAPIITKSFCRPCATPIWWRVVARCGTLSLTGIDPAAAGQRDTDPQLRL